MKKSMIAALSLGLLCSFGTLQAKDFDQAKRPVARQTAHAAQGSGESGKGMVRSDRSIGMKESLGLSDSQQSRIEAMGKRQFQQTLPQRQEILRLQKALVLESLKGNSDRKKLAMLSEMIGKQHAKLAYQESRNLKEFASLLSRSQIVRLLNMGEKQADTLPGSGRG